MTYNNKRVYTDSYGNQYIFVGTRQFAGAPTKGGGFFSKIGSFFSRGKGNNNSTTTSLTGASPKKTSFSKPLNTIRRQDTNKNTSFFKSKSTTNTNNSKTTDWFSAQNKQQQNKSIPGAGANPTKPMGETPTQAKLNKEQKRQENKQKNIKKRAEEQARKEANRQRAQEQQNRQSSQKGWGNRQQQAGVGSQQNQSTVSVESKNKAGFQQNPSQKGRMNESKTFIPTNQNANPSATVENAAALRTKGTQHKPVVTPNANANPTNIVEKAQQTHQQTQKSIMGAGATQNQVNKTVVQQPRPDSTPAAPKVQQTQQTTPPPQPKPQQQPQQQPNPTPTPQPITSQPNTNTAFDKAKAQRDANIAQYEKNKAEGKSATTGQTLNYWGDKVAQKFDNAPSAGDVLKGTKDAVSTGVKEGVRRTANIIGGKKRWDKFHEEYAAARNGAEKTAAVLRGTGNGLLGVAKRGITGAAIAGAGALAVGGLATMGAVSAGKRVLRAGANAAGSAVGAIKQAMPNPQQHPQPQPAPGTVPQAVVHHYH